MELNIYQKLINIRMFFFNGFFFNGIAVKKKLRYVQIHFSGSNSSFEVMDNVLKLPIRGVNKKLFTFCVFIVFK